MRALIRRLLDEDWIVILASGIGLGYAALNLAQAIGTAIEGALEARLRSEFLEYRSHGLTVGLGGDHVIDFSGIVSSGIAFVLVLVAVIFVVTRLQPRRDEGDDAT
jgi:hypothetical protein